MIVAWFYVYMMPMIIVEIVEYDAWKQKGAIIKWENLIKLSNQIDDGKQ